MKIKTALFSSLVPMLCFADGPKFDVMNVTILKWSANTTQSLIQLDGSLQMSSAHIVADYCTDGWVRLPSDQMLATILTARVENRNMKRIVIQTGKSGAFLYTDTSIYTECRLDWVEFE